MMEYGPAVLMQMGSAMGRSRITDLVFMSLIIAMSVFIMGIITVWGQSTRIVYIDFESTGCTNEGVPVKIEFAEPSANCDDTSSPLSGSQALKSDGGNSGVRVGSMTHKSRVCFSFNGKLISTGSDDSYPIYAMSSSNSAVYPYISYRTGNKMDLVCGSGVRSPQTQTTLNTGFYMRIEADFTDSDSSGCLHLYDSSAYQSGSSVCCSAGVASSWEKLFFGDGGLGFPPGMYFDEINIYNGPCKVSPLFEGLNSQDNGGSNSTSFSLSSPANREVGDLLLAFIGQESSNDCTFTPPTGWTQIGSTSNGASLRGNTAVYWNTLDDTAEAGTASWTWTSSCSREWVGAMHKIAARTYNDSSPGSWLISLTSYVETAASVSSFACQSVSGLPARAMVARAAFYETGSSSGMTATWSAGTESFDVNSSGGGAANIMVHGVEELEASGSVGPNTSDLVGTNTGDVHCWTIPIKPSA